MMKSISSSFLIFCLFCGLVLVVVPIVAFSQTEATVIEFDLVFIDNSYDVPEKTESHTNSYTNETTTTTIPGYRVENKTIEVTIKNEGASYYNFRFKAHNENEWNYYPKDPTSAHKYNTYNSYSNSPPYEASNSSYTVITLPSGHFQNVQVGDEVDVQVQALFGDYETFIYGFSAPGGATYDFIFQGTVSDWSNTQTVTFEENAVIPEFPSWLILPLILTITMFSIIVKRNLHRGHGTVS